MDRLTNLIKSNAASLDSRIGQPRLGTVTSVRAADGLVRVKIHPDEIVTGWLPTVSLWIGQGWGLSCPFSPGDQVLILPQEGYADHGVVVGAVYSERQRPAPAEIGELALVHRSGAHLRLSNDGTVRIKGDLYVDGEVHDRVGSLGMFRSRYNEHRHRIYNNSDSLPPQPEA